MQIRPLGMRECLIAFELVRPATPSDTPAADAREAWTLWDAHGRPHVPYPDLEIDRPMTGREVMVRQQRAWADHVAASRRLFGAVPLSGVPRPNVPLRGLLVFPVEVFSERGRWTLVHRDGPRWHFTPQQLLDGLPRPVPPATGSP